MTDQALIAKVSMLAGKIMLESGAETYRVEDTMTRIAAHFGFRHVQCNATPTAVHFSTNFSDVTNFVRIENRTTDLHKIADVNQISRNITKDHITVEQALAQLKDVDHNRLPFPYWVQILAAAFVSGSFAFMFGGDWPDVPPALIAGGIGYAAMLAITHFIPLTFVAHFAGSMIIGLVAVFSINQGIGHKVDNIIIGAVMPLVPGLPITNSVRDLIAGHLVAGLSKGAESLFTAFAIGAGIAVTLALF